MAARLLILEQVRGKASLNVLKLARNGLAIELRTLITDAAKKDAPVKKEGVLFNGNGYKRVLNLSVSPLGGKETGNKRFFLVLFDDVTPQSTSASDLSSSKAKGSARDRLESKQLNASWKMHGMRCALPSSRKVP